MEQSGQEQRRRNHLAHQRKRRQDIVNWARQLVQGNTTEEEENGEEEEEEDLFEQVEEEEQMDQEHEEEEGKGRWKKKYRPKKLRQSYKNQLMQSEWLVEVPEDFDSQWLMVPVPQGRRSFVISGGGNTYQYSRYVCNLELWKLCYFE